MSKSTPSDREVPIFIRQKGSLPGFTSLQSHWHQTTHGSNLHFYANSPGVGPADGPILILAHGFPQTSYIFRYMIPALVQNYRLFVPDQPGIAYSTDATSQDKLTLGKCYIEGLVSHYGKGNRVILGGHDRGARIMQRLAVSKDELKEEIDVLGVWMLDIVPIVEQFKAFAQPGAAARYFHWSFLPVPFSVDMIMAYGGEKWVKILFENSVGQNAECKAALAKDDGVEVSAAWYGLKEVNEAAAKDYAAAAGEDHKAMVEDQEKGRKIEVPTLVLHGVGLAAMNDVGEIWPRYVKEGVRLEIHSPGEGYGHYLPEECPEWTTEKVLDFVRSIEA